MSRSTRYDHDTAASSLNALAGPLALLLAAALVVAALAMLTP